MQFWSETCFFYGSVPASLYFAFQCETLSHRGIFLDLKSLVRRYTPSHSSSNRQEEEQTPFLSYRAVYPGIHTLCRALRFCGYARRLPDFPSPPFSAGLLVKRRLPPFQPCLR